MVQNNRYNGDGQRIQKTEGDQTTNYYYQDGVVSYTTDGSGEQTSQNLIGENGSIIARQKYAGDSTRYYVYDKDIQGSTTSLIKEDGSADATYQYTDFGETRVSGEDQAGNEVCYTGGIYDQSTGLYYLNARYYDPGDGRFVTEDTYRGEVAEPDTQNLYAYCAGNPVNYVDPSGHKAKSMGCIYYNAGKNLIKQAKNSPYYRNESVQFYPVHTNVAFKNAWNKLSSKVESLFMYIHTGYEKSYGRIYMYKEEINLKTSLIKRKFSKKTKIKYIRIVGCEAAKGGNKSVAKAIHDLAPNASIYASYEKVSFYKIKKKYYPRYSKNI